MVNAVIYVCAALLGAALMAFEMLVSRMLTPYFGGDIYNWAAVISVVLFAMMVGYFLGGWLVDRNPTLRWAALFAAIAGCCFLTVELYKDPLALFLLRTIDDVHLGVLIAAFIFQIIPVAALGAYSPIAIRIALTDVREAGRTSGRIYAVSTTGNVVGVMGAVFVLIPHLGVSESIALLALICFLCSGALYLTDMKLRALAQEQAT